VLLRCHPHGYARKVGQTADVVPMRMGQEEACSDFGS
jgi:hypothetical protein